MQELTEKEGEEEVVVVDLINETEVEVDLECKR
jgi:hypothetical protein